ncbi:MAG: hypothetical protein M1823_003319 [Watsoniomyces obsoletus]|nr:MAG: hypothetical protein M1823_003319 [Watsoniomyces obsoletus]
MRFGQILRRSIHEPWTTHYIDYSKLKKLLREHGHDRDHAKGHYNNDGGASDEDGGVGGDAWTDDDEGAFVEELVNVQLEKVHAFQVEKSQELQERTARCESKLAELVKSKNDEDNNHTQQEEQLKQVLEELDGITRDVNELEKFSRINFTGFLKAAKKHDRRRGHRYRVKPLLQVRLGALPFNSEDYSPLLYRLSVMYSFVRQHLEDAKHRTQSFSDVQPDGFRFISYKYWVHPDNIMEVKTFILRHLPLLVYNPQSAKVADGTQDDPTITSVYLDNPNFSLYAQKVDRIPRAASVRLRWYGKLKDRPQIFLEKKVMGEGDSSEESRITIKDKYIQPFWRGEYKMEKSVRKLQDQQDQTAEDIEHYQSSVDEMQRFILENNLQPMLRANYTRTAFQIPGDNRLRVSLDTNVMLIREDSLDEEHPCRERELWHRRDIDDVGMEYPFTKIAKQEKSEFPFALLEIRMREGGRRKIPEWITDLRSSHLVHETCRFSKFVHGVAVLFEDHVNSFPFWISELDKDIRKDPAKAIEEENQRAAIQAEEELAVGSFLSSVGMDHHLHQSPGGRKPPQQQRPLLEWHSSSTPTTGRGGSWRGREKEKEKEKGRQSKQALLAIARQDMLSTTPSEDNRSERDRNLGGVDIPSPTDPQSSLSRQQTPRSGGGGDHPNINTNTSTKQPIWQSLLPSFSRSRFARRLLHQSSSSTQYGTMSSSGGVHDRNGNNTVLPPGLQHPGILLKDSGPINVEPKVWLANERTFIRWQHAA